MRLFVLILSLFFFLPAIAFAQTLDIDAKTVHVLYFDNIASEDDLSDVLPFQDFERQINYLQKENYRFLTLKDLKNNAAEKSVVILLRVLPSDGMRKAVALLKRNALPFDIAVNYNQNIRHSSFPILRLDIANQPIEKMQEKLNRDTSRFRDRFGVAPRIVIVTDPGKYKAAKDIFDRYNFEHIILPNGQATIPSQIISAIPMDKRTSSLDILGNYLERRTLPVGPILAFNLFGRNRADGKCPSFEIITQNIQ
ncbi:MAG: hypothetical protein AAGB32_05190 [Pseudomonadota bacterium]